VAKRATKEDPWGNPENLGPNVNTGDYEGNPFITADGLSLYFVSGLDYLADVGTAICVTTRSTKQDPWGPRVRLGDSINTSVYQATPFVSPDGLSLFFSRGYETMDIYVSRRANTADPWGDPVRWATPVNSDQSEFSVSFCLADPTVYFARGPRPRGVFSLFQAPVLPIVDFNGDGIVDIADLVYLINVWGTHDTLGDIGPTAWGDGKVDQKDLEVLMSYWGQTPEDPTLVAQWALDESGGNLAPDTLGVNNATLYGGPVWQPTGGKVDGALEFDGVDDYVKTPGVLNPSLAGPFSVLAWVKGGAPGQVIFSQQAKANWLAADATAGRLTTELKAQGGTTLQSQSVVTDGQWHRVGLVWDGSNRLLYMDGKEVARDTQSSLAGAATALYIGAGNKLTKGTFWSGLIDDVRIYGRAVKP
jgi:hypothetical protein